MRSDRFLPPRDARPAPRSLLRSSSHAPTPPSSHIPLLRSPRAQQLRPRPLPSPTSPIQEPRPPPVSPSLPLWFKTLKGLPNIFRARPETHEPQRHQPLEMPPHGPKGCPLGIPSLRHPSRWCKKPFGLPPATPPGLPPSSGTPGASSLDPLPRGPIRAAPLPRPCPRHTHCSRVPSADGAKPSPPGPTPLTRTATPALPPPPPVTPLLIPLAS